MTRSCVTRNRRSRNVIAYRPVSLGAAAGLIRAAAMTSLGAAPTAYTLRGPAIVDAGGNGAAAGGNGGKGGAGGAGGHGGNGGAPGARRSARQGRPGGAPAVRPAHLAEPPAKLGSPANPAAETGGVRLKRRTRSKTARRSRSLYSALTRQNLLT